MKLDDRDIVCETDYSPLSSAELAAQIEWHASAMSGATAYDLERITGPARALLARAEAAEVGRDEANLKALQAEYRIIQLEARVAELEAALVGMDGHMARLISERNGALDRAEAAERERDDANTEAALNQANAAEAWQRVAELEAQVAAQGWRPVTEEPPSLGYYLTVDFYGVHGICYWGNGEWQYFDYPGYRPTHWQPLPPPPDVATEATE